LPGKDNAGKGKHVPLANAAQCSVVAPRIAGITHGVATSERTSELPQQSE